VVGLLQVRLSRQELMEILQAQVVFQVGHRRFCMTAQVALPNLETEFFHGTRPAAI
jgi:hypothetical protein